MPTCLPGCEPLVGGTKETWVSPEAVTQQEAVSGAVNWSTNYRIRRSNGQLPFELP